MIIYGWRGITSTKQQGTFECPRCGGGRAYAHKSVRRWFTLYFLPVIPLDHVGEYVECQQCRGTFIPEVLLVSPEYEIAESVDSDGDAPLLLSGSAPRGGSPGTGPLDQARRIFVLAALANGEPRDATLSALQSVCKGISGVTLQQDELRQEVRQAQQARTDMNAFAGQVAQVFDAGQKAKIVAGVHIVLAAERGDTLANQRLIRELGQTLGLPDSQVTATLQMLQQS